MGVRGDPRRHRRRIRPHWGALPDWLFYPGEALLIAGLVFTFWSYSFLGRYVSSNVHVYPEHRLIEDGPCRYTSDPKLRGLPIDRKNRVLYERWHRRPARDVIAYHRAVHRDVMEALRALPESYFAKRRSPYWPGDLTTHAAGHRRRHLEAML